MFHQSRQIGKVGEEQTSRHLLPAWRCHIARGDFYCYSKRWQDIVISTNIVSGGKTWQWEVLEIFFQCLANSLHSGSYDNSHHTSGTKWIWHFGFEIWNLSNVFDFLPYNHLVFWIRLDLLGETLQELPILSLVNLFWIKGNVKILAQYLLQKKSLTSLTLTKSQFQLSINSSASIMIVQLPWKGVDKLISIVDVFVIAPFLVSLSQYYFMIVNFLAVNPLLSFADGDV